MAVDVEFHLLEEREGLHVFMQKIADFGLELAIFLAVETEMQPETVRLLEKHGGLGPTVLQGEADGGILGQLVSFFTPIFHQGDVRWTLPFHAMDLVFVHKMRSWYLNIVFMPLLWK